MCLKRGRKVTFEVFLTFLEAQNLSKFLGHLWACIFFHDNSKNAEFSSKGGPHQNHTPGGVAHQVEKPVF